MDLAGFLSTVDALLDRDNEESILALTPHLIAFGQNKPILADAIEAAGSHQGPYAYFGSTIVLAATQGYVVRVVGWPTREEEGNTKLSTFEVVYQDEGITHTHQFALLTYGCLGPGYVTDRYLCDPIELAGAQVGDVVNLGPRETVQLAEGSTLFYPAYRMAHVQHPPPAFSMSLNLMVLPKEPVKQFFIHAETRVVMGIR